ncbi:MAG: imidazoleglycerol-phosphate dehydratase HisB [Spirochaetaceae bacterium]|nr:imidazoleglycerol-phosphate dehydratase HisB [Spirochaetaceae bacterium]
MSDIRKARSAVVERRTKETSVRVELALAPGPIDVSSGVGFLDHLLTSLAFHGGFSLSLSCDGDLRVDDHHSAEDCALALGAALREALGDKAGVRRFGSAYAPLDESLARAVVDLSGRPCAVVDLGLTREAIGGLACENVAHVVASLANAATATIHLDVLRGSNDHHRAEAAFKALALALREAAAIDAGYGDAVPSAKGAL